MVPFAAKFGPPGADVQGDPDLRAQWLDYYAQANGHDPRGRPWILIVHADGSSEFFPFEDEKDMWCCERNDALIKKLAIEYGSALSNGQIAKMPDFPILSSPDDK